MKLFWILIVVCPFVSAKFSSLLDADLQHVNDHLRKITSIRTRLDNILPKVIRLFENDYNNMEWFQKWSFVVHRTLASYEYQLQLERKLNRIFDESKSIQFLQSTTKTEFAKFVLEFQDLKDHYSDLFEVKFDSLLKTLEAIEETKSKKLAPELNTVCNTFFNDNNSDKLVKWSQIPSETSKIGLRIHIIEFQIDSMKSGQCLDQRRLLKCNSLIIDYLTNIKQASNQCELLLKDYKKVFIQLLSDIDISLSPHAAIDYHRPSIIQSSIYVPSLPEFERMRFDYKDAVRKIQTYLQQNELLSWYDIWSKLWIVSDALLTQGLRLMGHADIVNRTIRAVNDPSTEQRFNAIVDILKAWVDRVWSVYGGKTARNLVKIFNRNSVAPTDLQISQLEKTKVMFVNMDCHSNIRRSLNFLTRVGEQFTKIELEMKTKNFIQIKAICDSIQSRSESSFEYIVISMRVYEVILDVYNSVF